jgi:hypothetical protein
MKLGAVDLQIPKTRDIFRKAGYPTKTSARNMPDIDDAILDCVFYLYPTASDAADAVHAGGTGFLVSIGFKEYDPYHVYAVSNKHVVSADYARSPVIRLNTHVGKHDVLPLTFPRWIAHPHGDDIAVAPLGQIDRQKFLYQSLDPDSFITKTDLQYRAIQAGHEVFMVGRFISHAGQQKIHLRCDLETSASCRLRR